MRLSLAVLTLLTLPLDAFAATAAGGNDPGELTPRVSIENHLLEPMGPPAPARPPQPLPPIPCTKFDLHAAVQFVGTACLQQAIRHMDVNGDTPLHNAIHFWNPPAIKFLIRNGADIHLPDFEGRNAIDLANVLGKRRLYEFLTSLERETERLLEAVDNNDTVGVSNSLLRGASLGMRDIRLDTPLHRAAESGLTDVGRLLVHNGASLEARNHLGETPLLTATLRDQPEFAQMLIEAGANVNAIDERRRTPLDLAETKDDPALLAMLQKKKARHGASASVEVDFDAVDGEVVTSAAK